MSKTTESVKAGKATPASQSTQRYLPFSEIRDNLIVMKDGSSRMVVRVHPVNFNLKSEEEQDSLVIGYQRFLNSLRFPIQIVVRSLKVDIESYLYKLKNLAVKQTNPLMQEQTYQYVNFLTNLVDMAQIMRKDFFIVVPFDTDDGTSVRDNSFFGVFRTFWSAISSEESVHTIRTKRRRVDELRKGNLDRVTTVRSALENVGMKASVVEKEELLKYLIAYYNPRLGTDIKIK